MSKTLVVRCSPRAGGVSDRLGDYFYKSMSCMHKNRLALRDYRIKPCQNCHACNFSPFECILDGQDDCGAIYEQVFSSDLVLFSSPIYFYALPAHFKAFIDRAQHFYQHDKLPVKPVSFIVFLAAGRSRGEKLFSGALLTMKWFLKALNCRLDEERCWRGLECAYDLDKRPEIEREIIFLANEWSARLAANCR